MASADILKEWAHFGPPAEREDAAQISLVWAKDATQAEVEAAVDGVVDGQPFEVEPAFPQGYAAAGHDVYWLVTFPDLTARRTERLAFQLARSLKTELGIASARPVLVDSLVGAAAVAPPGAASEAILGRLCNSDDLGPEPRGWAPLALGVREAWNKTRGKGVTVASIDTGYSDHPEVLPSITASKPHKNLVENNADARDRFSTDVPIANPGHGTLVMSVVASRGDIDANGHTGDPSKVTGTAPEAEILPIRAIRSVVDVRQSRIPAAIEHAILNGADVIVMALGSAFAIEPVEAALKRASAAGIVTVCAAGNCFGPVVFPARLAQQGLAAAIAAVDYLYQPWEKTSKGPEVTVSAFGEAVWGARRSSAAGASTVSRSQGTTLATSLTAGVAALWVAHHGGRAKLRGLAQSRGTTVQRLFNNAVQRSAYRPSGWPRGMGAGMVNAASLLVYSLDGPATPADVPGAPEVTPLSRYLPSVVSDADPLAGQAAGRLGEDFAAEALWRFYLSSARARATASGLPPPPPADNAEPNGSGRSPELTAALAALPGLRALT